jgi:hypothetical protein
MKFHRTHSLVFILMLLLNVSCIDLNPKSNSTETGEIFDKNVPKAVKEVILEDNGAVVPIPKLRRFVFRIKNREDILFSYSEQNGEQKDGTKDDIAINKDEQEIIRDEIDKIIEFAEDGVDVKAGKLPCVGMNSLNIAVVYNTGDTSRFAITGSARCDPSLYPSVWAVDSMAMERFRIYKAAEKLK